MRELAEEVGSRRVYEVAASGLDEWLQGIGGDPFGGTSSVGLRVPTLATPNAARRYLFQLASFSLPTGIRARIVGYRQLLTLGAVVTAPATETPGRFVEQEVSTPMFRLPDGNVSWHLHRLGPPNAGGYPQVAANRLDLRSFSRNYTDGPALLYRDYTIPAGSAFYPQLTSYTPPNGGKPWGTPLRAGQHGTFYDLRTESRTHGAWHSLDVELEGPDTIALFASVYQSVGATGVGALSTVPNGLPEEQFLAAFGGSPGGVIYWRVGGALIVEQRP